MLPTDLTVYSTRVDAATERTGLITDLEETYLRLLPAGSPLLLLRFWLSTGPGAGRKCIKGPEGEENHSTPLAARHQRRRGAGFSH